MDTQEYRIYVACLASYNSGILHGEWIDCSLGVDHINEEIQKMLKASREPIAEEYAIHDFELPFKISEGEDLEEVVEMVELCEEHGNAAALAIDYQSELSYAKDMLENYAGEHDSVEAFAEEFLESTGELNEIPERLRNYFDFAAYAHDLDCNGDITVLQNGSKVHVFWNN